MVVRRRAAWLRGWVAAVLAVPLIAVPVLVVAAAAPAGARPQLPFFHALTASPLPGELVDFSGHVTDPARRWFVQRREAKGQRWVTQERLRPNAWGDLYFAVRTPRRPGATFQLRVHGPGRNDDQDYYTAVSSKIVSITTAVQSGELRGPRAGHLGSSYAAVAEVLPVREGRTLELQRLVGGDWVPVDSVQQGTKSLVDLELPVEGLGEQVHRLRALPMNESRGFSTNTITVTGRDDEPREPLPVQPTVSAGDSHVCDLLGAGVARCWGSNADRRLGSETTSRTHGRFPVAVEGDARWSDLDTGAESTCAIRRDGELWCWGEVATDPDDDDWDTPKVTNPPVRIGDDRDWRSVDLGGGQACGLRANETLWCWSTHQRHVPGGAPYVAPVPSQVGWFDDWQEIAVGESHVCGLRTDQTLWCQGGNDEGQLGIGRTGRVPEPGEPDPVQVGSDRWTALGAAVDGTCGIQVDGSLWCWGETRATGDAATPDTPEPVGTDTRWAQVTVTDTVLCTLDTGAEAWCLGWAAPRGSTGLTRVATQARFTSVSLGVGVACGVDTTATTQCWGLGDMTGDGAPQSIDPNPRRLGIPAGWTSWASHGQPWSLCALRDDAGGRCWGTLGVARGTGSVEDGTYEPARFAGDRTWRQVAIGYDHSCGVSTEGGLFCWGDNRSGELGQGFTYGSAGGPTRVGDRSDWVEVVSGDHRSCALRDDGSLWCWGVDVGAPAGTNNDVAAPRRVGDESTTWLDVHLSGWATTCAVRSDHTLWCWGYNDWAQLGIGARDDPTAGPRPMTQVGNDADWASVRVADYMTCAIKLDQSLWCWGLNNRGQTGNGTSGDPTTVPQRVSGDRTWSDVLPIGPNVCGTTTDGRGWCWGNNVRGGLGDGTFDDRFEPAPLAGDQRWREFTYTGLGAVCGIDTEGSLWCWGSHFGYFGLVISRREPAPVGPTATP